MQIISQFVPLPLADPAQGTAVAMGYFDGIHIGHRAVIDGAVQWARAHGAAPAVFTFRLPVESVFTSLPLLVAGERVEQHLYNGCPTSRYPAADGRYRVRNAQGQFLGLANITGGVLRVEKLFVERN